MRVVEDHEPDVYMLTPRTLRAERGIFSSMPSVAYLALICTLINRAVQRAVVGDRRHPVRIDALGQYPRILFHQGDRTKDQPAATD